MTIDVDAGRYRTGQPGYVREWDGHAWSADKEPDTSVEQLPKRGRRGNSTRWCIALVAGGWVVGLALAIVGTAGDKPNSWVLAVSGLISCGGTLIAAATVAWERLRLAEVVELRRIIPLGVLSGAVALAGAFGLEKAQRHLPGPVGTHLGSLFGAGVIEETMKLLVPVLLFFFVGGILRDPRVGFALVFLSGLVFGIVEGAEYVAGATHLAHDHHLDKSLDAHETERVAAVVMAVLRSAIELMHPFTVAAVAAVAWTLAWRGGRFFSRAAVLTFVAAMVYHSVNDGVIGGIIGDHMKLGSLVLSLLLLLGWFHLAYLPRARQLAPPAAVPVNPRRWRPE